MEEREALKREIELLQNLINKHKRVHGDAPFPTTERGQPSVPASSRGRGRGTSAGHSYSFRGRHTAPQSSGSWRKTHSLRNKSPQPSVGQPSASTSLSVYRSSSLPAAHSISLPSNSGAGGSHGAKLANLSSGITQQKEIGQASSITVIKENAMKNPHTDGPHQGSSSVNTGLHKGTQQIQTETLKADFKQVVPPSKLAVAPSAVILSVPSSSFTQKSSKGQVKPSLVGKTSKQTPVVCTAGNTALPVPALSTSAKQPSLNPKSLTSQAPVSQSSLKKSKFTWVKSQNVGGTESRLGSPISSSTDKAGDLPSTSFSKAAVPSGSSALCTASKRTPAKKIQRKHSPVAVTSKTSKYKWVSSSAGVQTKSSRKPVSAKALSLRALEKGEATKRLRSSSAPSFKTKRATTPSPSSRYSWKAGGHSARVASAGASPAGRRSAFHWSAEKSNKGGKVPAGSPTPLQRATVAFPSPGSFKLRSRMKIVRKYAKCGGGSEKGSSPSAVKYSPRAPVYNSFRSPMSIRRTSSRELVSFGRHKMRRLSPTSSRTIPTTSCHGSPASQRVFRTHYKMVTRQVSHTAHTVHFNPNLSWRAKRIQLARSFLQGCLSSPQDRRSSSAHHRRGSGMCWIGGSLYRVSANKLSRTVASNVSMNQTGRSFNPHLSSTSTSWNRTSSTRHLASRAVQRSLAIIRHASQKKQQKQYCMYYNRFGKCNRGNHCPYIHDPEKVAVCTRFLRGTCRQADGSCPFSHKVDKEKMPVCSYFLKGICNNSDCPYSHVYVSHKAEVCDDFVKGYCPEGEKCKKKHTLVCPDFSKKGSCPRGRRCKLQHRQPAKSSTSATQAKRRCTTESSKRPCPPFVMPHSPLAPPVTPAGPLSLPSFISLCSSPEEPDAPDALPAETSQVKERKLQIKPRL